MPMTPDSGALPYATPAQMLVFCDARRLGMLVRDDNTQSTPSQLLADPNLVQFLATASGEVETAALAGSRYKATDLAALQLAGGNGAAMLARLVARLAYGIIDERRNPGSDPHPATVAALKQLDDLRSGMAIFPFAEAAAAGLVVTSVLNDQDRLTDNLVTENARVWGVRANRACPGGWGYGSGYVYGGGYSGGG